MSRLLIILLCTFIQVSIHAEEALANLRYYVDGLNREGGRIPHEHLKEGQVWANLCLVLDRPFANQVDLIDITKNNKFPLKEASILEYNEYQANLAYALLLKYYILNAHKISNKSHESTSKITLQVHRNSSGPKHVALLDKILKSCLADQTPMQLLVRNPPRNSLSTYIFPKINVVLEFRYGSTHDSFADYEAADIVLSVGLISGFHPKLSAGALILPHTFTPFDMSTMEIHPIKTYHVKNHLIEALDDMLKEQSPLLMAELKKNFASANPSKQSQPLKKLTEEDFKAAHILQVDENFNPKYLPSIFKHAES